jgi:hypothetical protein
VLQVRSIVVSSQGLRIRFNQAIDPRRLDVRAILVVRGETALAGRIEVDPDGEGLRFVLVDGVLSVGDYRVVLTVAGGAFVTPQGELLDGDYDGQAGGDYRGNFTLPSASTLPLPPAAAAATDGRTSAGAAAFASWQGGWGGVLSLALAPGAAAAARRRTRGKARPALSQEVVVREGVEADGYAFAVQQLGPRSMREPAAGVDGFNAWEIRL